MEENMVTIFLGSDKRFAVQVKSEILRSRSRYFADVLDSPDKLDTRCTDVETRLKLIKFLQSTDVKRDLRGEGSNLGVVQLLKDFQEQGFYTGAVACLEYLEAVPWTEVEGRFIRDHLQRMLSYDTHKQAVLARLPSNLLPLSKQSMWNLMKGITQTAKPEVHDEIRNLISDVVTGEPTITRQGQQKLFDFAFEESYKTLLNLCRESIHFPVADAKLNAARLCQVSQHLWWFLGLMIAQVLADDIVDNWVKKSKFIAPIYNKMRNDIRFRILMVPIKLCIGIGSKNILAPVEARSLLLETWLPFIYDDYKLLTGLDYFDKKVVEEGIGKAILTLPYSQQQRFFEEWLLKFHDDDYCPNLRLSYQVWWRLSQSLPLD